MDWLNYHHLRYFAAVVREGSIAKASRVVHTSQPTISTQLQQLERALGEKLLRKQGRSLVPTDMGRLVYGYAEQIFGLGRELLDAVRDRPTGRPLRVQIGVADVVPKELAFRLLEPLLAGPEPVRLLVREGRPERLVAELAAFHLDLVIADAETPVADGGGKVFRHALGESGVGVFATEVLARGLRRRFPASLAGAPFVLPLEGSELRRELDAWQRDSEIAVEVVGELEDIALATTMAASGHAALLAPTVMSKDLRARHGLALVGELPLRCRFVALTVERRVKHPAVARLLGAARGSVFG